jgi:riboflavin biosynthesis pyrimidine reductase
MNFLDYCREKSIQSILVEGGTKTIEAFIREVEVQEIIHIESNEALGRGISAPTLDENDAKQFAIGHDNQWKIQLGK